MKLKMIESSCDDRTNRTFSFLFYSLLLGITSFLFFFLRNLNYDLVGVQYVNSDT